ncbi:sigma-54 dependent transcriptional regulator [Bacteriovorax sp. DB6_IX]|uniref:sigma-54-dependent transcriptional regulator n=1 Tax=Bacteriovorax sp. DB6_IX TaxID=1353530 RepID=UPI0018DFF363|nr:sigma 54-interacting transcriptional regulator [Bacteriovorax sp. DB6_IX]
MSLPVSKICPDVKESFICIGDYLEIFPLFGKKKVINLNRTHYMINEKKSYDCRYETCHIEVPTIDEGLSEFELMLIQGDFDSFLFKTSRGQAFKLNGNFCHEAYLQSGDELIIGHNRMIFKKKRDSAHNESLFGNIQVAESLNILIEGETGIGKTTLAKKIHEESSVMGDFVHVNLSSFPPSLIESELFGHVRGAFTGAVHDKVGALEQAKNGTLFLDEIDSLPLDLQVKLLLFLDDYIVRPVGAIRGIQCHSRIIFASGQDLRGLVDKGLMRRDFFFRVSSGQKITLPSLRDSREILNQVIFNYEADRDIRLSSELKGFLRKQKWPGNIRQLYGHLDKKRAFSKSKELGIDEFDRELIELDFEIDKTTYLLPFRELKKRYFEYALSKCANNHQLAAKKIDVSLNTMKKFTH